MLSSLQALTYKERSTVQEIYVDSSILYVQTTLWRGDSTGTHKRSQRLCSKY